MKRHGATRNKTIKPVKFLCWLNDKDNAAFVFVGLTTAAWCAAVGYYLVSL